MPEKAWGQVMSAIIFAVFAWLFCIGLMIFCVYLVSRYPIWFEKNSLKFLVAALIMGLGIYFFGYYFRDSALFGGSRSGGFSLAELISSAALSFVSMSRMLVLELDIGELGIMGETPWFRALYGLILLMAVYSLAVAVLSFLGGKILSKIRIFFFCLFGSRKPVYIIYGFRPEMRYFVKDIRKNHPGSTILIFFQKEFEEEEHKELVQQMMNLGCVWGNFVREPKSAKDFAIPARGIKDKIFFIAAAGDTESNMATATSLCRILKKEKRTDAAIGIYGLVSYETGEDTASRPIFEEFSVHWADIHELCVRQLMISHPLTDSLPPDCFEEGCLNREIEIAVIGYSPEVPCLCRSLLTDIQFKGVSFRLILIGEDISEKSAPFRWMNPGIDQVARIECVDVSPGGNEFFRWLKERADRILRFYCMSEETEENILIQKALQAYGVTGGNSQIYALARRESSLQAEEGTIYFGLLEQIFSEEMIIHEKLDRTAAAVHMYYQMFYGDSKEKAEESWKQAKIFEKESSRSLALHLPAKLYSMGYQMKEGAKTEGFRQYLEDHPLLVKNLAYGEHLRWETFFFTRGWTGFDGELPEGKNKDLKRKRHACLVPWDELKIVGERYHADYQYLDEHFIRNMDQIAELAGCGLVRRQDVLPKAGENAGEKTV